jgi:hypothetical protein
MENNFDYLPKELFSITISYIHPPELVTFYELYTVLFNQAMTKYPWSQMYEYYKEINFNFYNENVLQISHYIKVYLTYELYNQIILYLENKCICHIETSCQILETLLPNSTTMMNIELNPKIMCQFEYDSNKYILIARSGGSYIKIFNDKLLILKLLILNLIMFR